MRDLRRTIDGFPFPRLDANRQRTRPLLDAVAATILSDIVLRSTGARWLPNAPQQHRLRAGQGVDEVRNDEFARVDSLPRRKNAANEFMRKMLLAMVTRHPCRP